MVEPAAEDAGIEVHLVPLRRRHLRQVLKIEAQVYPRPWTLTLFMSELNLRNSRHYVAARVDGAVVGYAGLMYVVDEAHVTNIAVDPAWHRHKIGTRLLLNLARAAHDHGARHITLEVRVTNLGAQAMYRWFGFEAAGIRKNYYAETNEDALIMWAHNIDTDEYAVRLARIEADVPGTTVDEVADPMKILAIETSCDETAAAVVEDGRRVLSSVVSSQIDLHARFGGVVPEIAGRAHVELLTPVVAEALARAELTGPQVDAVAATIGPGLIGSLLVGVSAAKAYALAWGKPFVGVNHLEGHLHAAYLEDPDLETPAVVLLVSGGHTMLIEMSADSSYRLLGQTIDDAAGEAFDKVARFLGLGYPGGPAIDRIATEGNPSAVAFPRGLRGQGYDFSFSGLKTSVMTYVRKHPETPVADVAASFQEAVVDVLVEKARRAAADVGARAICIGGGVAANSALRQRIVNVCHDDGRRAFVPGRAMCTDNAAMVGATAWHRLRRDGPTPLDAAANPNLRLVFTPG